MRRTGFALATVTYTELHSLMPRGDLHSAEPWLYTSECPFAWPSPLSAFHGSVLLLYRDEI
jgi:hypothetical protein